MSFIFILALGGRGQETSAIGIFHGHFASGSIFLATCDDIDYILRFAKKFLCKKTSRGIAKNFP